ncbi:SAM-dependent methyltransferase [Nonlabens mediterrranea]|uniref:SAM-dependent methyltransferase n=1 Tax=Nonlabens mediterrranea TaxID=1419947 RepID=A0ABS0A5Q5_9FLAO|nr:thiopurine methyltransferase [Flavobacteria bacterium BBFL7]MBF4984644.1 SAM-dependent methyltransferase [Nonlabens mediterrranea]
MPLNKQYWEDRYKNNSTGWDLGIISTPIKEYVNQLENKNSKILIPGAGNAHEATYLVKNGFKNIFILDIALSPLKFAKQRSKLPEEHLIQQDFFDHKGSYDLIIEQTFFCALEPRFRESYVKKIHMLLRDQGCLIGVLFNFENNLSSPPFGGSINEYLNLFEPYFEIVTMEPCNNSVIERQGKEIFIKLKKKK